MAATDLDAIVARNIRAAREAAGMTQNALSKMIDASGGMVVSNWENGKARPSRTFLIRLSEVLKRDAAWFYTDHNSDERQAA